MLIQPVAVILREAGPRAPPQKGFKGGAQGNRCKIGIVSSVCPSTGWAKRSRMTPPLQPSDVWAASQRTFRIEWLPGPIWALHATHSETRKPARHGAIKDRLNF